MALTIKNKFVREDILDEKGNKIGEIKFNPSDSAIMKSLADILEDLSNSVKKLDEYKNIEIPKIDKTSSLEEFEKASSSVEQLSSMFNIEYEAIDRSIKALENIFGKDTINCFTGGTKDLESLVPLIDFIAPYVQESRTKKVNKYIKKPNDDVME